MDVQVPVSLPVWDTDTLGFWEGAHNHQLMVKRCADCGYVIFPFTPLCRRCSSFNQDWVQSSGRGLIYTWTTVYLSTRPEFVKDIPYSLAAVELEDFPVRIPARLKGVEPGAVHIGARVEVRFEDLTPEVSLPYWIPAGGNI